MEKIGTLIVEDDFNNILILKKKAKRGQSVKWSFLENKITGKDNGEKSINKAAFKILKTVIFDLEIFKTYESEEKTNVVFTGKVKGRAVLDKSYDQMEWVSKKKLNEYEFEDSCKEIIKDLM